MTDDKLADIKRKITAMIAKAQSTDNEHEAAAFMGKALDMMDEYQIAEWQLGDASDPMGRTIGMKDNGTTGTWVRATLVEVARFYGCDCVRRGVGTTLKEIRNGAFELDLIGRESSRVTAMLMWPFILGQVKEAGKKLNKQGYGTTDAMTRKVANALCFRIYHMREAAKAEAAAHKDARTDARDARALVVINEIESLKAELYPELRKGVSRSKSTNSAAREAAAGVSLHRQTGGAGQLKIGSR